MVIHHVVTALLVGLSYEYGHRRVGGIVMILMDPADVFLHYAKLCKYLAVDGTKKQNVVRQGWQTGADVLFAVFAVVFIITRVIMYPYVTYVGMFESHDVFLADAIAFPEKNISTDWWEPNYVGCRALLVILLILQLFWFYLLLRAIKKVLLEGAVEDE